MPGAHRLPLLLAFLFVLAALSGCGSDEISGEIPADKAAEMKTALADLRTEVESNPPNCEGAALEAQQFVAAVNNLPADIPELKTELQGAGDHLRTLVDAECSTTSTAEPTTTPATTEPATTPATTEPTTTDTTTTDTTTTDTTTDEEPPPGDGDGGGPPGDGGGTDGGTGGTGGGGTGDETGD